MEIALVVPVLCISLIHGFLEHVTSLMFNCAILRLSVTLLSEVDTLDLDLEPSVDMCS